MINLAIRLGRVSFNNPIFGASGCFGHGYELAAYTDISRLGAITLKTVTLEPRQGNRQKRIVPVTAGMLSSIGLQNQGFDYFISEVFPKTKAACRADQIIVSVAGNSHDDYLTIVDKLAEKISPDEIAAIQINTACPNVQHGGGAICQLPNALNELMTQLVKLSPFPVIGKINTNASNYCEAARAVEASGADAICLTNTPIGMAIDIKTRRPILGNVKGPLAGPAIKPLGVARTWDVYNTVKIPIITGGGVTTANDVIEYLLAGATAIDVGSATFVDPDAAVKLLDGLLSFVDNNALNSLDELIGTAHRL